MKILALCDSPTLTTGFACVARNFFKRWATKPLGGPPHGAGGPPALPEIEVWAIGFTGHKYRECPYVNLIPGGSGGSWASPASLSGFLTRLSACHYTHVWMMQDTFMLSLSTTDFPIQFREICRKKNIRSCLYFPIDAPVEKEWLTILGGFDQCVAYTRYGKAEAESKAKLLSLDVDCAVVGHGVDPEFFFPLPPMRRAELRDAGVLWNPAWVEPDDFLMINVNVHQRRKDVTRSLEILAELRRREVPAKLWMHMDESQEMVSLDSVGRQLGLKFGREWGLNPDFFRNGHSAIGEHDLHKFYNVADLLLSTSLGEGWGLSITEALACGLPIAVPDHTSCREIMEEVTALGMGERCVPLPVEKHAVVLERDNSRRRFRVDVDRAVDAIEAHYHAGGWKRRQPMNDAVRRWLSWDRIAAEMFGLLQGRVRKRDSTERLNGLNEVSRGPRETAGGPPALPVQERN